MIGGFSLVQEIMSDANKSKGKIKFFIIQDFYLKSNLQNQYGKHLL